MNETALSLWNDTPLKKTILDFVRGVSDTTANTFVPPRERVAVFDNDGTLWVEKPRYVQLEFILRHLHRNPDKHEAAHHHFYQKLLGGAGDALDQLSDAYSAYGLQGVRDLAGAFGDFFAHQTQNEYFERVQDFFAHAQHPVLQRPYTKCFYAPMVELVRLLRANEFRVFVVTGGSRDFVRFVCEDLYDIPRENIIGSSMDLEYKHTARGPQVVRGATPDLPIDDHSGKPVYIEKHIGRKPIFAVGNSDGDIQMLEYTSSNPYPSLELVLHHDDAAREFAYDHHAKQVMALAEKNHWHMISMARDFVSVFPDASK